MAPADELDDAMLASAANQHALNTLLRALREERPLLLAGEGVAASAGYPTREGFLLTMEARLRALRPASARDVDELAKSDDLAWRAEEGRRLLGENTFRALVRECWGTRQPPFSALHASLVALPWAHVLTTSFDPALEHAHVAATSAPPDVVLWNEHANVEELLARSADPSYRRRYVYLHGRFDREGIVLADSELASRYGADRDRAERLLSLFDRHPGVVVGASLTDTDLASFFRRQSAQRASLPRHFAFLPWPDGSEDLERRRIQSRYGIDPIFYVGAPERVLAWLRARLAGAPVAPTAPERPPSVHLTRLDLRGVTFAAAGFDFGPRLNLVTGANSAGKTVVLDALWWALTDTWATQPLLPDRVDATPTLAVSWSDGSAQSATFTPAEQTWQRTETWARTASLAVYMEADGSVAVYDPRQPRALVFSPPSQLFDGVRAPDGTQRCNGIIEDLVHWRSRNPALADAMNRALARMSPPDMPMRLGEPRRVYLDDAREFPTVVLPYGEVPVVHASAAVRRVLGLTYAIVWAWNEHRARAALARVDPAGHLVVLLDEAEAHLHPLWQRGVMPALFEAVAEVSRDLSVQVFATTHSPLVTASVEPLFDPARDRLFHLALRDGAVHVDDVPFARQGDASAWLLSETFGMKHARSIEAERALEAAKAVLRGETPAAPLDTKERVHAELKRVLAGQDDFWPRWIAATGLAG